eukprot:15352177-Alexandrium_andersonii.AAC.1
MSATTRSAYSFLASSVRIMPAITGKLGKAFVLQDVARLAGCASCLQKLASMGLSVTAQGRIGTTPKLVGQLLLDPCMVTTLSCPFFARGAAEAIHSVTLDGLHATFGDRDRARLLALQNNVAGCYLQEMPRLGAAALTDTQWVVAARFRVGLPLYAPGQTCALRSAAAGSKACAHCLDPF